MTARDRGGFAYFCSWKAKVGPGRGHGAKKKVIERTSQKMDKVRKKII